MPEDRSAIEQLRCEAESGDAGAQYQLAVFMRRRDGLTEEVITWYRRAAEQDNTDAQLALAMAFSFDWGTPKNYKEAVIWFRRLAERGHADAQHKLGWMLSDQDPKEAVIWYRRAAEQENEQAQFDLGCSLKDGRGTEKDPIEALQWLNRAAEQGVKPAHYHINDILRILKAASNKATPGF